MRDSPSFHRPPSPPPLTPAGSSWTQHELEQGIEGGLEDDEDESEQHLRARSSRDSGISLGERQQHLSPSHAHDDARSRPLDSAQRSLSPYPSVSGAASSAGISSPSSSSHPRPPSALSSTSSSHPSGSTGGPTSQDSLASPRLVAHHPYASSSLSSAAAFDYDDLLGPHPRRALSGTSVSPPSSNEDDKLRRGVAESHVQGLGLTARAAGGGRRELYGQDEGGELGGGGDEAQGDEHDERWESLRTMSLSSAPPTSSSSDAPTAPRRSSLAQYAVRQSSFSSTALVGSPLSPHVAPFAPSSASSSAQQQQGGGGGTPTSTSGGSWISPREREASWNSAASSSYAVQAQQRALPSLTSHSSTTSPHTPHYAMSYASQHGFSHYAESSSSAPLVAPAMSESSSRGAHGLGGETFFVSRGPPRAPYTVEYRDRSGSESYGLNGHGYSSSTGLDSASAAVAQYDAAMQADVSTIFVVGFPDDMTEREFTNMFAFADGFEAATLKFPYPRDGSVAGSEGGGSGLAGLALGGGGGGPDEPFSSSSSSYPGPPYLATAHEGHATGASTPLSATASANGTSTPASTAVRKIIGFARFDTRQHALAARETLNGRRVDYERGSVLKAEMAKKNLHMRKNVLVTATAMSGSGSGSGGTTSSSAAGTTAPGSASGHASAQAQQQQSPYVYSALHGSPVAVQQAPSSLSSAAPDVAATSSSSAPGPSIPLSSLDSATLQKLAQSSNLNPAVLAEIARQNLVKASTSADSAAAAATEAYQARRASEYFEDDPASASYPNEQAGWAQAPASTSSSSPPHQPSAAPGVGLGLGSQRSMLQQLDEGIGSNATASNAPYPSPDLRSIGGGGPGSSVSGGARSREASYASMSGPVGAPNPYSTYASPGPGAAPLSPGLAAAAASAATAVVGAVPSAAARQAAMHPLGSPTGSFSSSTLGGALAALRTQNPADMNAPKNTLYVGGLPAVLPSLTGPFSASHLEDSLRNAFSRCPGYRRLQFRYKSNGPIVFVEFFDTAHATRAMQELYGHTLGGLVKGGIRLSYSKNPLGVRSNGQPALPPPELIDQRPPHYVLAAHQQHSSPAGLVFGQGAYGSSPYVSSSSAFSSDAVLVVGGDPHRRPPDPIYGETAYPRSSSYSAASPGDYGGGGGGGIGRARSNTFASAGSAAPASPSSAYGGAFSPFSVDL
ncbi:uncharacterized protein RHOBADRAFT_50652 [Rhodotorula graminis WP1]|uniref:RRM domain-containing protein n=1 Tax=Rhodotorula graminis (strain WP1) TaxID=578459 RepID=A0A194SC20_RHOGW|nr:uncharacterized protein RHOBADRAFT_50652 [Rhodotorula graminis WP1]KPV78144.1 hypothetical protein RHOBADRAFT_50652 [Rhodotorula graminis WP1]